VLPTPEYGGEKWKGGEKNRDERRDQEKFFRGDNARTGRNGLRLYENVRSRYYILREKGRQKKGEKRKDLSDTGSRDNQGENCAGSKIF